MNKLIEFLNYEHQRLLLNYLLKKHELWIHMFGRSEIYDISTDRPDVTDKYQSLRTKELLIHHCINELSSNNLSKFYNKLPLTARSLLVIFPPIDILNYLLEMVRYRKLEIWLSSFQLSGFNICNFLNVSGLRELSVSDIIQDVVHNFVGDGNDELYMPTLIMDVTESLRKNGHYRWKNMTWHLVRFPK